MPAVLSEDTRYWFVLNHIATACRTRPQNAVEQFNRTCDSALELFAPTYVVKEAVNGKIRLKSVNLTFHYVFVKGTPADVKRLCSQDNGFSFLLDRGAEARYAIISESDMAHFKTIARAYKNCLPYYSLSDITLEDGDLVEVINGDFPGLIGTYMPRPRSKSGDIVLRIFNNIGTIAFNVRAQDIRIIQFAKNSTRANDQIDAFVPHLLKALRLFHTAQELPSPLLARLSIFCRRMEVASPGNRKLNAKLQALLSVANQILGNAPAAQAAKLRYDRLSPAVTNEWTAALIRLIFAIIEDQSAALSPLLLRPTSKMQTTIAQEYEYYTTTPTLPE